MILLPSKGVKVRLAFDFIEMRKGIDGLALLIRGYGGRIAPRVSS
jgi:hypothetical protein